MQWRRTAGYALLLAAIALPARAQTAFDGLWAVTILCVPAADGAAGYSLQFPARVAKGVLVGQNGLDGKPGSMHLAGTIQPDGSAILSADGLTSAPVYSVGRVAPLTPYHYEIMAHFEAARGSGTRVQTRPCSAQFLRQ